MNGRPIASCLFLIHAFAIASSAAAMSPTAPAAPTCALLPSEGPSPVQDVLEARLSQNAKVRLLDRSSVTAVLREQQLAGLLAAGGTRQRVAMGKLLRADLLVSVRRRASPTIDAFDVNISETAGGLRLLVTELPSSGRPEEDAIAIERLLEGAMGKRAAGVSDVWAVPPFVNQDLERKFDPLQAAYARLVEAALLDRPGALVVDLAEARAFAQEIALSGGPGIARQLPLYILGEFRNSGDGPAQRVRLMLAARRGEREVARQTWDALSPREVADVIRRWPDMLERAGAKPPADVAAPARRPNDATTEAAQLAERGRQMQLLSNPQEALELFEASLLLNPHQTDLRFAAVNVLRRLPPRGPQDVSIPEFEATHGEALLAYYDREVHHLEHYLRGTRLGDGGDFIVVEQSNFLSRRGFGVFETRQPAPRRERALEIDRRKREMLFQVLEAKRQAGETHFMGMLVLSNLLLVGIDSPDESADVRRRAVRLMAGLKRPIVRWQIENVLSWNLPRAEQDGPAYARLLDDVEREGDAETVLAVRAVREKIVRENAPTRTARPPTTRPATPRAGPATRPAPRSRVSAPPAVAAAAPEDAGEVLFHRLEIAARDAAGKPCPGPGRYFHWIPCAPGIDVVADLKAVYIMKEKGVLKRVFSTGERFFNFVNPCYDGRYVWLPVKRPQAMVLVLDPATEQLWEITAAHGLPGTDSGAAAAALAPGRICLAGGFGRGWIARAALEPDGRRSVEVFFEAKEVVEDHANDAWRNLHLAFSPHWIRTIRAPANAAAEASSPRVLMGRGGQAGSSLFHPLLIDPAAGTVEILADRLGSGASGEDLTDVDGTIYGALRTDGREPKPHLWRFGLPELRQVIVKRDMPEMNGTPLFTSDGRIHLVGDRWWIAKQLDAPFAQMRGKVPSSWWTREFVRSRHYGLILLDRKDVGGAYGVEFKPSP